MRTTRNYDPYATIDDGSCDYSCTITGEVGFMNVTRAPTQNSTIKLEILVDGILAIRTVNKLFVGTGNTIWFDNNDYEYNK